jgi:hypothetical protein
MHNTDIGSELLSLLKQQRYLYHQLRLLTDRQRRHAGTSSPKLLLEIISGRRKLVEKLRELNTRLHPIKAGWNKLSPRISPEHHAQARELAAQTRHILAEIAATTPSELARNLPLDGRYVFDELLIEPQSQK